MARLSITLLGTFQIAHDGEPVTDFATDKARALLAYLAAEADRPHRRDALAGLLWPDQPQKRARQSLRQALSDLRKAVGDRDDAPFLLVSRGAIQFNLECDHWLDVEVFSDLMAACETHRHRRLGTCLPCIQRMERMVDLYRGPFLEQFFISDSGAFEEWAVLKREWLQRAMVEALAHLAGYHERRGDYRRAQQHARRWVQMEPWCEEAHRLLMRLLALDGQRSTALTQYEACRRVLAEDLGVEPTAETTALYQSIMVDGATGRPRGGTTERPPDLLIPLSPHLQIPSPPTPFVGREREMAELAELLANPDCRLVTLFGPGGIGKTRLALQVAADHVGAFEHGVVFVPLAQIDAPDHLIPVIADAFHIPPHGGNLPPEEQLLNYLREKELLLVLDGVEHVLARIDDLAVVLGWAPGVMLLVTSRERLNLQEEWVYEVKGLACPKDEGEGWKEEHGAVELFRQRARQVDSHFSLGEAEIAHVARICRLVEGMPLGIELAASWVGVRSCEEIAREIGENLDALTTRLRNVPERHRSIRASFEHSWRLLSEAEQAVLARLSVFRGGFGQEAAAQIAGASSSEMAALLDKSLVRRAAPDRYDLHELLRQYAAEKLQEHPQAYEETQARHACYFSAFLARQEVDLKGMSQKRALVTIAAEIENARRAWQISVACGDVPRVEQAMEGLFQFFAIMGRFQEGLDLLGRAVQHWIGDPDRARVAARALSRQGVLQHRMGHSEQALDALTQALGIFERLDEQDERVFCMVNLANVSRSLGQYGEAERLARQGLALSRQMGNRHGIASALHVLGLTRYRAGDVQQAQVLLEESLAVARESGDQRLVMAALNGLGDVICHAGDYARARRTFEECLELSRELEDQYNIAVHLNNLGTVLHTLEQYEEARLCYQESLEICRRIGDRSGQAIALSNLGEIACALGVHSEATAYYQQALSIGRATGDQWSVLACLNNLGEMACAMDDLQGAQAYLVEALRIAMETETLPIVLKVLANLAILFAKQGQQDRAAVLLGAVLRHPASEQAVLQQASGLLEEMDLSLPDAIPDTLEAVVAEILDGRW